MLRRPLNVGFSGGEKKRMEILQMALLAPSMCILDETDSGLDIDALRIVADGVNALRAKNRGFLVITHYQRLLDHIVPDTVHVMSKGRIVKTRRQGAGAGAREERLRGLCGGGMMAIVTPLKTAAEQVLAQQFADAKAELPGAPAVRKLREDAFAGFEAKGLPHRRLESWRYTDLRTLLREARPLADAATVTPAVEARLAALKLDGVRLVLVDGVFAPSLSTLEGLPEGVSVQALADALVSPRDDLTRILAGPSRRRRAIPG